MTALYLTADTVGIETGGGKVTAQEYQALREMNPADACVLFDRKRLQGTAVVSAINEPWFWDDTAEEAVRYSHDHRIGKGDFPELCHIYAGTWGKTVPALRQNGCKVAITVAAHDRHISRKEHEALGLEFPYPHLTDEIQWHRYIEGYRQADVIVCPSTVAAKTVREYGRDFEKKDIRVIPHGCDLPQEIKPFPKRFTVGYMGSFGADKGVRYLLQAWKELNYPDATLLLAGRDSTSPWAQHLVHTYGGGNIRLVGWVKNPTDFYNSLTILVQPSCTEGFGLEVLEAMAHGRPVVCSDGAGAADLLYGAGAGIVDPPCDAESLAASIDFFKYYSDAVVGDGKFAAEHAEKYTWDKIRSRYVELWKEMLV